MFELILKALYFFLPAYFANMAPVFFKKVPFLSKPIQEQYFGKNKTWRGVIVAVLLGIIVFSIQKYFYQQGFTRWALIDYNGFSLFFGALLGFGAIFGDLVKSYYKRKEGLPSGKSWVPYDQLDFVFGALIFSMFIYVPPVEVVFILLLASPLLHVLANYLGYLLKIKETKF